MRRKSLSDSVTAKIKTCLQVGYNTDMLADAVKLLGQVPWSTTGVEQGHGSLAVMHRFHPDYTLTHLCSRAMIHQVRSLCVLALAERVEEQAARVLQHTEKRQLEKATARHMWRHKIIRR